MPTSHKLELSHLDGQYGHPALRSLGTRALPPISQSQGIRAQVEQTMASVAPNIMADSVARARPPRALLTSKDIGTLRLRMIKQVLLAVGGL